MIKICHLIGTYNQGGVSRVARELSSMCSTWAEVTLVCRKIQAEPTGKLSVNELSGKSIFEYWSRLKQLVDDYDIIHCHDIYALPAFKGKRRAKIVFTYHGVVPLRYNTLVDLPGSVFAHMCSWLGKRYVDVAIGISRYMTKELCSSGFSNVFYIPNGVDTSKFRPIVNSVEVSRLKVGEPTLLKVGAIDKFQGLEVLINAMPYVLRHFPKAKLVLVGQELDTTLRRKVRRLGVEQHVIFAGFVPDQVLVNYYNAADIVIEIPNWHGFGLPILEGMACGKPVITRNAYAMREHILSSGAGLLVNGDDPKEVADAIFKVMTNYYLYAHKARSYAERFNWVRIADEYKRLYLGLLKDL
jgi:glycosyltransferase involved in cell wall biosynthesis